jgi:hypothetical protein
MTYEEKQQIIALIKVWSGKDGWLRDTAMAFVQFDSLADRVLYELREDNERLRNTLETIADIAERNSTMESLRGIGKLARESLIHKSTE